MKRTESQLPHAFAMEQLRGKGHSEPSYSLSSVGSSFMPSVDNVSSQSSTGGSPPPVKSTKASLCGIKLEVQRAYIVLRIFILLRVCDTYDKIQIKEMAWKCRVIWLACENRHVYDCNLWFVYAYMTYVTQTLTVSA
jgi:hypothetical protein